MLDTGRFPLISPRSECQGQKVAKYSGRTVPKNNNHIIGCKLLLCNVTWETEVGERNVSSSTLITKRKIIKRKQSEHQTAQRPGLAKCLQRENNKQNTPANWPPGHENSQGKANQADTMP